MKRSNGRGYILPLLFFKRISDVWDEEATEAAETFGDVDPATFPEVHRFSVPDGCTGRRFAPPLMLEGWHQ